MGLGARKQSTTLFTFFNQDSCPPLAFFFNFSHKLLQTRHLSPRYRVKFRLPRENPPPLPPCTRPTWWAAHADAMSTRWVAQDWCRPWDEDTKTHLWGTGDSNPQSQEPGSLNSDSTSFSECLEAFQPMGWVVYGRRPISISKDNKILQYFSNIRGR